MVLNRMETWEAKGEALIIGAVNALVDQTRSIDRAFMVLSIDMVGFEGSDSLDNPVAVLE